jgi:hypothetical protein
VSRITSRVFSCREQTTWLNDVGLNPEYVNTLFVHSVVRSASAHVSLSWLFCPSNWKAVRETTSCIPGV